MSAAFKMPPCQCCTLNVSVCLFFFLCYQNGMLLFCILLFCSTESVIPLAAFGFTVSLRFHIVWEQYFSMEESGDVRKKEWLLNRGKRKQKHTTPVF